MNEARYLQYQNEINAALDESVSSKNCLFKNIFEAMRYSLNAGGKRIRPILTLEFSRIFGVSQDKAMPFAIALEMIHTYSLIHDDLPCMDDDDLRRGLPTNHKKFGEAIAVLSGDALLNRAFEHILEKSRFSPEITLNALKCLANASGAEGMIGGQVIDMEGENRALDINEIKQLQDMKTGALIKAGAIIGCILGGASFEQLDAAREYAENLGLAFQIRDDILNVEGDIKLMGKDCGNDEKSGKSTFVKLLGIDTCKEKVRELTIAAELAAKKLPDSEFLIFLAYKLLDRKN